MTHLPPQVHYNLFCDEVSSLCSAPKFLPVCPVTNIASDICIDVHMLKRPNMSLVVMIVGTKNIVSFNGQERKPMNMEG